MVRASASSVAHEAMVGDEQMASNRVSVRRANGDALTYEFPSMEHNVYHLRRSIAEDLDAPRSVINIVDADTKSVIPDHQALFGDGDKQTGVAERELMVIMKNISFDRPLVECLGLRRNTREDVKVIIYQMDEIELGWEDEEGNTLLHKYALQANKVVCRELLRT